MDPKKEAESYKILKDEKVVSPYEICQSASGQDAEEVIDDALRLKAFEKKRMEFYGLSAADVEPEPSAPPPAPAEEDDDNEGEDE